jgi:uncharacterized membrane protein YphA (DoxX/SURF4 family)
VGLLLLRIAVGVAAIVQGGVYLSDRAHPVIVYSVIGVIVAAAGALVLIGFLTPVTGMLTGMGIVGTEISRLPESAPMLLDSKMSEILALAISAAIVLLGPGAFSLDARLFGHREIIIPPSSPSPKT